MTAPYIGPDTVDLVIREPAAGVDDFGRPNRTERIVPVGNSVLTVTAAVETRASGPSSQIGRVIVYQAKAALPVTVDTRALTNVDAIRGPDGKVFDLTGDAIVKRTLIGGYEDHVRVFGTLEQPVGAEDLTREQVTITPTFGRDLSGQPLPDGVPFVVMARTVQAGNTTDTRAEDGTLLSADFTVSVDLEVPVKDGDRVTVRGRTGYARVSDIHDTTHEASERVLLVRSRIGGRR